MRWDDQIRGIQTIDQVHVRPGEDGDWIIRLGLEVLNQLIKFTYALEMDEDYGMR